MLAAATVAAEDRRFYRHIGVDPVRHRPRRQARPGRAVAIVEGGSTITQQVAKLLIARRSGGQARGVAAKVREAVLALRLEHRFDEARDPRALSEPRGVRQSDRRRRARELRVLRPRRLDADRRRRRRSWPALPQRPSAFNPYRGTTSALARQRQVLRRMEATGVDHRGAGRAKRLTSSWRSPRASTPFAAPHFVERVLAESGGTARRPHRDDARRRPAGGGRGDHPQPARAARCASWRANVAVVVLDNAHRRVAGVGGIGRLLRRRARRGDRRRDRAAPAGLGAEAVHLRAGVRAAA